MKIINILIVLAAFCIIGCCNNLNNSTLKNNITINNEKINIDNLLNATVALTNIDENGERYAYCSGVFVKPTIIITARHCVVDSNLITLKQLLTSSGIKTENDFDNEVILSAINKKINISTYEFFTKSNRTGTKLNMGSISAEVVYITANNFAEEVESDDLAVLKVSKENESKYWVNVSKIIPKPGDEAYLVGMPHSIPWVISKGIISAGYYLNGKLIGNFANIFISQGFSGGPLVNSKGEIIGIANKSVTFGPESQSNLGLYLTSTKIEEYLLSYQNEKK
jgi:hypothetical protein